MKLNYLFLFLIICIFSSCVKKQSNIIPDNVTNSKTEKHILISGTKLYIIPPKDFNSSKLFIGLSKGQNAVISIVDVEGGNFYVNAKDMSKETFEKMGAKVFEYKEFKLNGFQAKYIHLQGDKPEEKNISLAFGDTTFVTAITCFYLASDSITGDEIKASLLTIFYDKTIKPDYLSLAKFELNTNESEFKFIKYAGGSYIYSTDSLQKSKINTPFFIVTQMPFDQATDDVLTVATNQMVEKAKLYGSSEFKPESKKLTINGYNAIETTGYYTENGQKFLSYILILGKENNVTMISSKFDKDYDSNLMKFKKLIYTIKLR